MTPAEQQEQDAFAALTAQRKESARTAKRNGFLGPKGSGEAPVAAWWRAYCFAARIADIRILGIGAWSALVSVDLALPHPSRPRPPRGAEPGC